MLAMENNTNDYMLELQGGIVIDATYIGNAGSFANHCCAPNTEYITVAIVDAQGRGVMEIGALKALRDIRCDGEIFVDYSWVDSSANLQKCNCGVRGCKGFIGVLSTPKRKSREGYQRPSRKC